MPKTYPFGLCLYGMTYSLGLTYPPELASNPSPLAAEDFAELAAKHGASMVEVDLRILGNAEDPGRLRAFSDFCLDRSLKIVVDGPSVRESGNLRRAVDLAESLGADRMRVTLSSILCADRRAIGGLRGWEAFLTDRIQILSEVAPHAEAKGIRIAVENHQDATSWDLIRLCEEVDSPFVGITFDVGNALSTAEDPVAYAARVLPYLVHCHFKDYRMFNAPEGYRLVRCPFGEGVVDFEGVLKHVTGKPGATYSIELAALENRYIRLLADDYWAGLGPRDIMEVLPVIRLWRERGEDGDYETPWEKREIDKLAAYESLQIERSMENARALWNRIYPS